MRKIVFDEPTHAKWIKWRKDCETASRKIVDEFKRSKKFEINNKLYKRQKSEYYKEDGAFFGKCAYCEAKLKSKPSLDHYRPKKAVADENGNQLKHPGYYWLVYSWDNLLPSCASCNEGAKFKGVSVGKQDKFPVRNIRARRPGDEVKEKPLILNPTIDDPAKHLEWSSDKGKMMIGKTKEGKITIKILWGESQDIIKEEWETAYNDVLARLFGFLFSGKANWRQERQKFTDGIISGKAEYSFVRRAALRDVKDFSIEP